MSAGNDFVRVRVPLSTFVGGYRDSARAEVELRYEAHALATLSGPAAVTPMQNATYTANATKEFRASTYQWWVDGVSQAYTGAYLVKALPVLGWHTIRSVITSPDGHVRDLSWSVLSRNCPGGGVFC